MKNKQIPTISIVMGMYNAASHLRDCMESMISQTFSDFELIIVDDGSTDQSVKIVESFKDPRVRLLKQENRGLPSALNKAIALARGEYVARMDADDIAVPERLEAQLSFLRRHPEVDILGTQAIIINENGVSGEMMKKPIATKNVHKYLEYACPLIHPSYMVKAGVYRSIGGYREELLTAQDFEFLLRATEAGFMLANVPQALLLYRYNPDGISAKNTRRQLFYTRRLLQYYKSRKAGSTRDKPDLKHLADREFDQNAWFGFWLNVQRRLMQGSRSTPAYLGWIYKLGVVGASLMHYELFLYGRRMYLARKWIDH